MSCEANAPLMTERARHKEITLIVFVILTGVFIAIVSSRYRDTLIPHDSHEQAQLGRGEGNNLWCSLDFILTQLGARCLNL